MGPRPGAVPSGEDFAELAAIQKILALAHHRNKNQHRRSRWWQELGMLRRGLARLVEKAGAGMLDLEDERERRERMGKIVVFLKEEVVPRCWLAFSAVVADNQYAALGLMLLATLGRLARVLGVDSDAVEGGVVLGAGDGEGRRLGDEEIGKADELATGVLSGDDDLGVVLRREELDGGHVGGSLGKKKQARTSDSEADTRTLQKVPVTPSQIKPHKKRRKKKGDEFDELFSSLI